MADFVPIIKFFFYYVSQLSQVREIRVIGAIIVTHWLGGYAHYACAPRGEGDKWQWQILCSVSLPSVHYYYRAYLYISYIYITYI